MQLHKFAWPGRTAVYQGESMPPTMYYGAFGKLVGLIVDWIKSLDGARAGAGIGKAEPAVLTVDHHEPQTRPTLGAVRGFHKGRPSRAAAKQARAFFPF